MMNLWDGPAIGNKRVAKTKKAIFDALLALIKEKEIGKITVTELAAKAGVDRKTFYHYFKSVEDVFGECEDRIISSIVEFMRRLREEQPDRRVQFFDIFNRLLIEHQDFADLLVHSGALPLFLHKAGVAFKSEVVRLIEQDMQDWSEHDRAILEFGCLDLASGIFTLYLNWFKDHREITLEETGRLAKEMAVGSLTGLSRVLGKDLQGLSDYI